MVVLEVMQWWYGRGFLRLLREIAGLLRRIRLSFSVGILLRTLFAPWKRIITYGGQSIADRARAALDNLISRLVGCCVRLVVLFTATFLSLLAVLIGLAAIVIWPLAPFIGLGLIIWGILAW